jgi:hypothetical protein
MAANWIKFVDDMVEFLSSKSSSGPIDTGNKMIQIYLNSIRTAQTPTGNFFFVVPGEQALQLSWGLALQRLASSNSPTAQEKLSDPTFSPEENAEIIGPSEASEIFEKNFQKYLRTNQPYRFSFSLTGPDPSEYVLETRPEVLATSIVTEQDRISYDRDLLVYNDLKNEYSSIVSEERKNQNKTQEPEEKDPYDEMALGIITFWATSGPTVFTPLPVIPPALEPLPGTYQNTYPGNPWILSNSLRRAFNLGLREEFRNDETGKESARAIAKALAAAFSLHLYTLNFLYFGTTSAVPVVSVVPFVY